MTVNRRPLVVPAAVYLGAVVLVGVPAMVVLPSVFSWAVAGLGWDWLSGPVGSAIVLGLSLLIALQLAVEAAALQLGGVEALGRGSPRVALARHVLLAGGVFVVLAAVVVASLIPVFGGYGGAAIAAGVPLALVALVALYRALRAFRAGYETRAGR
ncbi:MAG: hypothetical protein M8354_08635 [Halalkalicoccus sp.]|nr:hypothetical protein [Halalkalicoccus sp.]